MNLNKRKNFLLLSLLTETFFVTYGLLLGNHTALDSIFYLLATISFIVSVLLMPEAKTAQKSFLKNEYRIKVPIFICMVALGFIISRYWLFQIPMDPDYADMLPVMKFMNERFLQGDLSHVYDPILEIWNGTTPIYLPAMWLPYAPLVALHLDMRWLTVISLLISFSILLVGIRIRQNGYFGWAFTIVLYLLFWWLFSRNDIHNLISMSEEGVVILYFVFLTLSIISGNILLIGISVSLCLLSRYSMIGWVFPFLIFLLFKRQYRKAAIFSITGVCFFLFFFFLPFGLSTLKNMVALPSNYISFASQVWEKTPEVFWLNPGMAKFYGPHHIRQLHYTLVIAVLIVPVIFSCFCLFQKKWNLRNINLACLKLTLLIFYQFIDVPYGYLFYTGSFVSLVIACNLLNIPQTNHHHRQFNQADLRALN